MEIPSTPSDPRDRRSGKNPVLVWSLVGVIVVECLYALWTASRGYFWQDDFIDLQALHQLGFSGGLFEQPVFGHFIPGFTLVDYLISSIAPYPWWLVVLLEVTLFGLSLYLLEKLLDSLFGRSWLTIALVAIAGASFSLVPSLVWWATALEYFIAIPATLLACLFHVRYIRTRELRFAVFGGLSIALGFAFYDGLFVSVLFIFLMTVLIWPVEPGLRGAVQTIRAYSRAWVCYGIPVALELGWRYAHPGVYITGGSATASQVLGFIGLSWTQTFIPLVFGLDAWVLPQHAERVLAGLLGQVIFVAFAVGTIVHRRFAWRAWVLIGCTFLASAGIVGATRAGTYGPGDASDVKYVAVDTFLLVIAVGFALLPVRTLDTTDRVAPATQTESASGAKRDSFRSPRPTWFGALVVLIVLAVVAAYGAALVFDQDRDTESAGSHASRSFFANFTASWTSRASSTSNAFLWDTEISPKVVTRSFYPYDTASVTIGRLHPGLRFDEWGGKGYLVRTDGSVVRASTVTEASGVIGDSASCALGGKVVVKLDRRLNGTNQRFGLVSYQSTTGAVATQSDGSMIVFPKGNGISITSLAPAPLHSVAWSLPPGTEFCVTGVKIVVPEPRGR